MKKISKIVVIYFSIFSAIYSSQRIEQIDDPPSYCRSYVNPVFSFIGNCVNSTFSSLKRENQHIAAPVMKMGEYIAIPEEEPTWRGALLKTSMGITGLCGNYILSHELKENYPIIDDVGYCVPGVLLFTGIRECIYLMMLSNKIPSYLRYVRSALSVANRESGFIAPCVWTGANFFVTPEERPTWERALLKTGVGFCGMQGIDALHPEFKMYSVIHPFGSWASSGLFFTGMREIIYLTYNQIVHAQTLHHSTRYSFKKEPIKVRQYDQIVDDRNKDIGRLIKASKLFVCSGISLYSLYNYDKLGNTLPFLFEGAFEYLYKRHGISPSILECLLFSSTLAFNINEIKYFLYDQFLTSSPIYEMLNNFALMGLMGKLYGDGTNLIKLDDCFYDYLKFYNNNKEFCQYNKNSTRFSCKENNTFYFLNEFNDVLKYNAINQPYQDDSDLVTLSLYTLCMKNLSFNMRSLDLRFTLRLISYFNLISSFKIFSLVKNNIIKYIYEKNVTMEEELTIFPDNLDALTKNKEKRHLNTREPIDKNTIANRDCIIDIDSNTLSMSSNFPHEESEILRTKTKTKGIAGLSRLPSPTPPKPSTQNLNDSELLNNINIRDKALERLEGFRQIRSIKKEKINKELSKAIKFLGGRKFPVKGSVFSIKWEIENSRFSMNYEEPHGKDSSNYDGNKLDCVLTVLETCYLVGLSKESAIRYIKKHNLNKLLRVDKSIYFIFFNRTRAY